MTNTTAVASTILHTCKFDLDGPNAYHAQPDRPGPKACGKYSLAHRWMEILAAIHNIKILHNDRTAMLS